VEFFSCRFRFFTTQLFISNMILSNNQFFFSLLFSFLHFLLYMLLAVMAAVIFPKALTLLLTQPWSTIELITIHILEFLRIIDLENIFHPSLIFHFKFKDYSWSWRNSPYKVTKPECWFTVDLLSTTKNVNKNYFLSEVSN